jgi:2-polyprenyl-3-methyl-5-hydroxy-6-metoxy-1,4-benzoquinol methylase
VTVQALPEKTIHGLHESLVPYVQSMPRDMPILDVGCGSGAWLERLADLGFMDLQGVDRDSKSFGCSAASVFNWDIDREAIDLGAKRFGLITAIEVIEHLENPGHFWDFVSTYLANEGRLLITTPNIHALRSRLRYLFTGDLPFFDRKSDPTHMQPMCLKAATLSMARRRLQIERLWSFPLSGSSVFRPTISWLAWMLRGLLPDNIPGDVVCVLIRRRDSAVAARIQGN